MAAMAAAAMSRQMPATTGATARGRRRAGTGRCSGRAAAGAAGAGGMSAVSAASSARVRAVSARPARVSSSCLVSRPCANASLSTSVTCSRSACDARMWSRPAAPAAFSSPGPATTRTSPPGRDARPKRNAVAHRFERLRDLFGFQAWSQPRKELVARLFADQGVAVQPPLTKAGLNDWVVLSLPIVPPPGHDHPHPRPKPEFYDHLDPVHLDSEREVEMHFVSPLFHELGCDGEQEAAEFPFDTWRRSAFNASADPAGLRPRVRPEAGPGTRASARRSRSASSSWPRCS
jgi:hypothetical protein